MDVHAFFFGEVDDAFWEWMTDKDTLPLDRNMVKMKDVYRDKHAEIVSPRAAEALNEQSIRRRITDILKSHGFCMNNPKVLNSKRCVSFQTLKRWYDDKDVVRVLSDVHPALLFNADETEINRKGSSPGMLAGPISKQQTVAIADRSGTHVTLFVMVSAAGEAVYPSIVLHGGPIGIGNHIGIERCITSVSVIQGIDGTIPIVRYEHDAIYAIHLRFGVTDA